MATELLFVPCDWFNEFDPLDILSPGETKQNKTETLFLLELSETKTIYF